MKGPRGVRLGGLLLIRPVCDLDHLTSAIHVTILHPAPAPDHEMTAAPAAIPGALMDQVVRPQLTPTASPVPQGIRLRWTLRVAPGASPSHRGRLAQRSQSVRRRRGGASEVLVCHCHVLARPRLSSLLPSCL